jgi:uncharacterized protein
MTRLRRTLLASCVLLVPASLCTACATVNCDAEAREAAPANDEKAIAEARSKCEKRLNDARRALKEEEEERGEEERRDAFRNRNRGQRR